MLDAYTKNSSIIDTLNVDENTRNRLMKLFGDISNKSVDNMSLVVGQEEKTKNRLF